MSKETFRLGELFCGPGGIAWGAHCAVSDDGKMSISHAWANDFDPDTCETYKKNICGGDDGSVYCCDVRELDIPSLGPIDAFAYGFPCNSFSNVGEHQGLENDKFGQLYTFGVEVLKQYQPKWFLAENVGGIQSANEGGAFAKIKEDMIACGYRIYPNLYKFEDYGVPQARHRVIIVGIRNDLPYEFKVPSPVAYTMKTCREAIEEPPIPADAANNEETKQSAQVIERLKFIKPGENAFTAKLPEELQIKTRTKISQIYRKLDPTKPAYTVTAAGGGGTFMYHWSDEQRELTNRERARIQTFPDNHEFVGKYSSVRKQIGMAVPPKGAEIIFRAILNTFAGIEYPSVEASMS